MEERSKTSDRPPAVDAVSLAAALKRRSSGPVVVENLCRLSGGASQETWSFDAASSQDGVSREPLILRRGATLERGATAMALETEAELQRVAHDHGVQVAAVSLTLEPGDNLGSGYVMERIEGETLAPRILRQADYAGARTRLAEQCGRAAAAIHQIPLERLPLLRSFTGPEQLEQYGSFYRSYDEPRPVFDLALRVLADRFTEPEQSTLVHGDFRLGNFIVDRDGLRAVLDWELAHLGDPLEDLAWVCVNSWRFGRTEKPVAGCGEYRELLGVYEHETGTQVDPERFEAWEIFGTLKWGIMCMMQGFSHLQGQRRSVEKVAIGRRVSETEADLIRLLGSA